MMPTEKIDEDGVASSSGRQETCQLRPRGSSGSFSEGWPSSDKGWKKTYSPPPSETYSISKADPLWANATDPWVLGYEIASWCNRQDAEAENHLDGAKLWRSKDKKESYVCGMIEGLTDKWSVRDILVKCEEYGRVLGLHLRHDHGGGFQGCGLVQYRQRAELEHAKRYMVLEDGRRKVYVTSSYKEFRIPDMDDVVGSETSPRVSSWSKPEIMHRPENHFPVPRRDIPGYVSWHSS